MTMTVRVRKTIIKMLPSRIRDLLRNEVSLVRLPKRPRTVISDLFPFRVDGSWETHFELLNVPSLIDPARVAQSSYVATFHFFDETGQPVHRWQTESQGMRRRTISINEVMRGVPSSGRGTFACFHEAFLPQLETRQSFLTERGYTGYANTALSKVRGYVHGNLDAIACDDAGRLTCLGKSFRLGSGEYRLQHQLEGPAIYEFCVVNTSDADEDITFEIQSDAAATTRQTQFVPSRGVMWISREVKADERARVVIHSKLNLPRPVVFRIERQSFDVFHG